MQNLMFTKVHDNIIFMKEKSYFTYSKFRCVILMTNGMMLELKCDPTLEELRNKSQQRKL